MAHLFFTVRFSDCIFKANKGKTIFTKQQADVAVKSLIPILLTGRENQAEEVERLVLRKQKRSGSNLATEFTGSGGQKRADITRAYSLDKKWRKVINEIIYINTGKISSS